MRELYNITCHQMRTLLKYHNKTVQDRDKELITVREMERDLIWKPRNKAFIEVTKDQREFKHQEIDKKLQIEIMFRQQTIEQLNRDIELVNQFMDNAVVVCDADDFRAINLFKKGMNIEKIGGEISRSYNNVHYRIEKGIRDTLDDIRDNHILDNI